MSHIYSFSGSLQSKPINAHPHSPKLPEPYIAAPELVEAVNLAIYLRRPLLLEGEAGCGKTRLASTVAYELGLPFYAWYVRSTSKAEEGLYSYDAVSRLHDIQIQRSDESQENASEQLTKLKGRDPKTISDYITAGPIGNAFTVKDRPAVVLIDEIDKADIDFPNDLLNVLDDPWAFEIKELGRQVKAQHKPIIFITSNREKGNLPTPFLRRCLYYFIEFPSTEEQLIAIIEAHNQAIGQPVASELVRDAIQRFLALRNDAGLHKKPSTSELLDWIDVLARFNTVSPPNVNDPAQLPYPEVLLKLQADWHYRRMDTQ